ncbi:MAG: rhamnulokinase [Planctomycetaceae bacterium]|nr:MAG: rhamnulokinase [Planctomycetaceae bacterium]
MCAMRTYLAIDLGAESGRVVRGRLGGGSITLEEIRRFPTGTVSILGRKHWNLIRLYEEMLAAFRAVGGSGGAESVGVDSWGVDFVLLGEDGQPTGLPFAYRDGRTDGIMEKFFQIVPAAQVYAATGIQFMQFNTLFQLFAMAQAKSPQLSAARSLLMIPDYFHHLFGGGSVTEFTNASTTACLNVHTRQWDFDLLGRPGIPSHIFQRLVQPGTPVGRLTQELQSLTGMGDIPIIAPATHDTASAVAAVPAEGDDWAYISSGTWSLMGVEIPRPLATQQARAFNFTNEGGVNGMTRLLKNVVGLWLVQQLRAGFDVSYDYPALMELASQAQAFRSLIDPADARFLAPQSMPQAFADFCRCTNQPVPETPGQYVRCALESLAMQYRLVLGQLRQMQDRPINRIHIIGGGSKNTLLCQLTADACGLPVLAGPAEGTALGNLIIQAMSLGHISSLAEGRAIIRNSFELVEYQPQPNRRLDAAWENFMSLKQ